MSRRLSLRACHFPRTHDRPGPASLGVRVDIAAAPSSATPRGVVERRRRRLLRLDPAGAECVRGGDLRRDGAWVGGRSGGHDADGQTARGHTASGIGAARLGAVDLGVGPRSRGLHSQPSGPGQHDGGPDLHRCGTLPDVPGFPPTRTAGRIYGRPDAGALARTRLSPILAGHDVRASSRSSNRRSLTLTDAGANAHADTNACADAHAHANPERDTAAITRCESLADARANADAGCNSVPSLTGEGEQNTQFAGASSGGPSGRVERPDPAADPVGPGCAASSICGRRHGLSPPRLTNARREGPGHRALFNF